MHNNQFYSSSFEIFKDAPAFQWMKDSILEEERKRVEAERLAEHKRIEAERLAEHKRIEAERLAEHKRNMKQWQRAALEIVARRVPKLKRLAQTQIATVTDYEELEQLVVQLSLAEDAREVEGMLLSLRGQEVVEEDEQ